MIPWILTAIAGYFRWPLWSPLAIGLASFLSVAFVQQPIVNAWQREAGVDAREYDHAVMLLAMLAGLYALFFLFRWISGFFRKKTDG